MTVHVHRGQLNWFRRKARRSPNELYAMLIGSMKGKNAVHVNGFAYPELERATPDEVAPSEESYQEITRQAKARGLRIVGTIHSHPNWVPVLSSSDHKTHLADGDLISGLVAWEKGGASRVYFWRADSSLPCDLQYFSED